MEVLFENVIRQPAIPDEDRFERIYIALYEPDGSDLRFFDIAADPPRSGRPRSDGPLHDEDGCFRRLLSYEDFLDSTYRDYLRRNSADFRWADGAEEPLEAKDIESAGNDGEDV